MYHIPPHYLTCGNKCRFLSRKSGQMDIQRVRGRDGSAAEDCQGVAFSGLAREELTAFRLWYSAIMYSRMGIFWKSAETRSVTDRDVEKGIQPGQATQLSGLQTTGTRASLDTGSKDGNTNLETGL
jgi:hypothetical protein